MSRDSIGNILRVSILLSLVCAVAVSAAAVGWRSRQVENKRLDQQKNVLLATGNYDPEKLDNKTVAAEFKQNVETRYIDLETDREVPVSALPGGADYDPRATTNLTVEIPPDRIGSKTIARHYPIYFVRKDGRLDSVVLPFFGSGLWSTMYGFLSLEPDLTTVRGITFYEHGETPGLGGEVDNPFWKRQWKGKVAFDDGTPTIDVIKGSVKSSDPGAAHKIDGLAGATITSDGVEAMINFWLGEDGFGPYIEALRAAQQTQAARMNRASRIGI